MDHWHMPCAQQFIDSPKTYGKIKTQAIQTLIDCGENLNRNKPEWANDVKIFVMISLPDLWSSQIIIFYHPHENEQYRNFFSQFTLLPCPGLSSIRNLRVPANFKEQAYSFKVCDDVSEVMVYEATLHFFSEIREAF